MARKEDRKKQKKRLKEQKKAKSRAARNEFPRTKILFDGEDETFMRTVEEIARTFDYANDEHCSETARDIYRLLRKFGAERLIHVCSNPDVGEEDENIRHEIEAFNEAAFLVLRFCLGDWLFRRLPEQYTTHPLPYYFFEAIPKGRDVVITFTFLPRIDIGTQRVWHSRLAPTVKIRGQDYRVGFTKHVFERACERMILRAPTDFPQLQMVAVYFRTCVYFEHVLLEDGQDALRLFAPLPENAAQLYLHDIANLKEHQIAAGEWSFILGYCPVALDDSGYAISKTLLFPGYANTPEAALVKRTRMNPFLRSQLQKAAHDNSLGRVFIEKNLKPLRWYHHNGVPQVVRLEQPLFGVE